MSYKDVHTAVDSEGSACDITDDVIYNLDIVGFIADPRCHGEFKAGTLTGSDASLETIE
jgi:hypothetical protein